MVMLKGEIRLVLTKVVRDKILLASTSIHGFTLKNLKKLEQLVKDEQIVEFSNKHFLPNVPFKTPL